MNTGQEKGSEAEKSSLDRMARIARVLFPFLLFFAAFLPRAIKVVTSFSLWHYRGIAFFEALFNQDWNATWQTPHPGVITMWLTGLMQWAASFFIADFDELSINRQMEIELILLSFVVALVIVLSYFILAYVFDRLVAAMAMLLVALDPYHISLSKAIHVDALLSVFTAISVLFIWAYLKDERRRFLILSGLSAGLAFLSKSPALFLIPYFFLAIGLMKSSKIFRDEAGWRWPPQRELISALKESGLAFLIWIAPFVFILFLLWPAMWSQPVETLSDVYNGTSRLAGNPHPRPIFFMGESTYEDPGSIYYPITMFLRTTAVVFIGFLMSIGLLFTNRLERSKWLSLLLGVLFVIFFVVSLSIGEKKFVRYSLPALQFITMLAGIGYVYFFRWLTRGKKGWLYFSLMVIILIQAAVSLPRHPYYGTHFNYLAGGPRNVLESGFLDGQEKAEGVELAADYLNSLPSSQLLVVGAQKAETFERFFEGKTVELTDDQPDYILVARSTLLREHDIQKWGDVWQTYQYREPKHVITFDGVPYVWLYKTGPEIDVSDIPNHLGANLGQDIHLLGYALSPSEIRPGDTTTLTLFWEAINQTNADYTTFAHLLDGEGQLFGQKDSQPQDGMYPTYIWDPGERVIDELQLTIDPEAPPGEYTFAIGMYELQTLERVPITTDAGELLPDSRLFLPGPTILEPGS